MLLISANQKRAGSSKMVLLFVGDGDRLSFLELLQFNAWMWVSSVKDGHSGIRTREGYYISVFLVKRAMA